MAGGDGEKRKKRLDLDGVDRITEFPVDLKEHILGCLTIKEAVAASIFSSKWRYCWTGLRKLKFDDDFWDDCIKQERELLEKIRAIDRVFMLHSGPIQEFYLSFPNQDHQPLDINLWLLVLSNRGVRKIEINACQYLYPPLLMPSCLFHCRQLEELALYSDCQLKLPRDFKGFANLKSLSLHGTVIEPNVLASLISGCLLLERLSLEYIVLTMPCILEARNLKTFQFDGYDFDLERIIFKDIPRLNCVSLNGTKDRGCLPVTESYNTLERLCSISWIKELTFGFGLLEALSENCPRHTPTPLENLNSLTLTSVDLCLSDNILFTFCLLRSTPNLRNLTIKLFSAVRYGIETNKSEGAAAKLLESESKRQTCYDSIKIIRIVGIAGLHHESLLIKILQECCPKAKSIIFENYH